MPLDVVRRRLEPSTVNRRGAVSACPIRLPRPRTAGPRMPGGAYPRPAAVDVWAARADAPCAAEVRLPAGAAEAAPLPSAAGLSVGRLSAGRSASWVSECPSSPSRSTARVSRAAGPAAAFAFPRRPRRYPPSRSAATAADELSVTGRRRSARCVRRSRRSPARSWGTSARRGRSSARSSSTERAPSPRTVAVRRRPGRRPVPERW